MRPYDKLTILRNRRRARDLSLFRTLVKTYFERSEYDTDGFPMDWEGAQAARAQINRMLPRVIRVVHAAGVGTPTGTTADTDPRLTVGDVDVLRHIFSARYANGTGQEIIDVIDMALGVYEDTWFSALVRTVNPLHYTATALAFVASLPRRLLTSLGLWRRSRTPRIRPQDLARLEAAASRLAEAEELIENRFEELRERQAQQYTQTTAQLTELAERLDFTERVLAQQRPVHRLQAPEESDVSTPS